MDKSTVIVGIENVLGLEDLADVQRQKIDCFQSEEPLTPLIEMENEIVTNSTSDYVGLTTTIGVGRISSNLEKERDPLEESAFIPITTYSSLLDRFYLGFPECESNCRLCVKYIHPLLNHILKSHFQTPQSSEEKSTQIRATNTDRRSSSRIRKFVNYNEEIVTTSLARTTCLTIPVSMKKYRTSGRRLNETTIPNSTIHIEQTEKNGKQFIVPVSVTVDYFDHFNKASNVDPEWSPEETEEKFSLEELNLPLSSISPAVNDSVPTPNKLKGTRSRKRNQKLKFPKNKHKLATDEPIVCNICNKIFKYRSARSLHMKEHTGNYRHVCSECGKGFNGQKLLTVHMRSHTGEKPIKCGVCAKGFASEKILRTHSLFHGEKKNVCEHCGKRFALKWKLRDHINIHTGEKPYECETCGKKYRRQDDLRVHKRIHDGFKPYCCDVCGYCCSTKSTYNVHMMIHSEEKCFLCDLCPYRCSTKSSLNSHMKVHKNPNKSKPKTEVSKYKYISNGLRHRNFNGPYWTKVLIITDTGEKAYKCQTCGMVFSKRHRLYIHMKTHPVDPNQQEVEKPHVCNICGKRFKFKQSLGRHTKICKEQESQPMLNKCTRCPAKFPNKECRRLHSKIHREVKSFVCEICNKVFTRRGNMEAHRKSHEKNKSVKYENSN